MPGLARFLAACLWLIVFSARAEVVHVEITERSEADAAAGYELIAGRLHFEIDPAHPRNRIIADIERAPTCSAGRVAFSADLRILKPKAAAAGNGAAYLSGRATSWRTILTRCGRRRRPAGTGRWTESGNDSRSDPCRVLWGVGHVSKALPVFPALTGGESIGVAL